MTFEEMYALACQRKKDMPEGKGTTELFKKGPHGIGKKLVEEAAESWMAAALNRATHSASNFLKCSTTLPS